MIRRRENHWVRTNTPQYSCAAVKLLTASNRPDPVERRQRFPNTELVRVKELVSIRIPTWPSGTKFWGFMAEFGGKTGGGVIILEVD